MRKFLVYLSTLSGEEVTHEIAKMDLADNDDIAIRTRTDIHLQVTPRQEVFHTTTYGKTEAKMTRRCGRKARIVQ